ncbi:flavin monoamine oxidase family protein [Polaribacter sp. Hel1_85]|uniref:flavin monoamine oxidase family protein n=1 Tax=Polaribacter sp. Hel1_85 TaxID=1250005 RepID=UPI00052DBE6A|nr:FAD-dependent oxidoreductase [Polaribacter sp. Hel1_85]KGL63368.1 amine oxidase, flavin-containing protein [Polaribacter sp. Hel1_85]
MSYLQFQPGKKTSKIQKKGAGSVRKAFSEWLIENHGSDYETTINKQRARKKATQFKASIDSVKKDKPLVGIVGGGFAGLYAGLILQSLNIECEVFESSKRVGGRIDTWYSTKYDSKNKDTAGLYGEVGGMRIPQFSDDMLPVQQLALSVNAALERNGLQDQALIWRKFYYNSPVQRLRYNNMKAPILAENVNLNPLNFGVDKGGDIAMVWLTEVQLSKSETFLPINKILDKVNEPFIKAINKSFSKGFKKLMKFDNFSMWAYLTNVFTLGDLGEYYNPEMGKKSDFLPYNIASYLETLNVGTGMYSVSFVEIVLATYDWHGSKNSYDATDENIYMVTIDKGMQHFPDACRTILNLDTGILPSDGYRAQILTGMTTGIDGYYGYSPNNLTAAAKPPSSVPSANAPTPISGKKSHKKERVFMNHRVTNVHYDEDLYNGHGGMKMTIKNDDKIIKKQYPFVISTLPNGAYLSGELKTNFFDKLSFAKARAIRECNYMPSFKAFITFKNQFWATLGERQDKGLGVAVSDKSNRQIVYPSYGYDAKGGVLQIYCWAQDAERIGALSDEERVNECLKGIQYLYPEVKVYEEFAGYKPEETTKTWFWDNHANGGAFALFKPGQFKNLYPTLLTPEFNGSLLLAGECCSVHHGWIVGALDSAYNAVLNILKQADAKDKIKQMEETWGSLSSPDVALKKRKLKRKV